MRYIPPKQVKSNTSKPKWLPEKWKGMVSTDDNRNNEFITLDNEWVLNNITENVQQMLKDLRDDEKRGYILIPEGANEDQEIGKVVYLDNAPEVKYFEKSSTDGSRRCVTNSAASGLYYLGHKKLAYFLSTYKMNKLKETYPMEDFVRTMRKHMMPEQINQFAMVKFTKAMKKKWDVLQSPLAHMMCLFGVHSSDGKTDHAICIVGNWIFDSNLE